MSVSEESPAVLPPLRLAVRVELPPDRAFRLFVDDIGEWWPLATHSVSREAAQTCAFEPRPGGRVFERSRTGEEHTWGRLEVWEPPRRIAFSWHPGRDASTAQRVEVTFTVLGEGTEVVLEHTGWELLGDSAAAVRSDYQRGWARVLGERYLAAAAAARR